MTSRRAVAQVHSRRRDVGSKGRAVDPPFCLRGSTRSPMLSYAGLTPPHPRRCDAITTPGGANAWRSSAIRRTSGPASCSSRSASGTLVVRLKYTLGTAARMGPGYFPRILGILLIVLGADPRAARAAPRRASRAALEAAAHRRRPRQRRAVRLDRAEASASRFRRSCSSCWRAPRATNSDRRKRSSPACSSRRSRSACSSSD